MNQKLKVYTYRHNLWLYDSGTIWKKVKRELGIILILFLYFAALIFFAAWQTR